MSRWHLTTLNFQTPATEYHLAIVRHPNEEGQDCIAGSPARVRVYKYSPVGSLQSEATGGSRWAGSDMLEDRTELVEFRFGWGAIEMWNQWGQKRVYNSGLRFQEFQIRNHTYKLPFRDYTISRATPGDVTFRAWFGDTANPEIEAEITLTFLDSADPEAEEPTGAAPRISVVRADSEPIHPGVAHTVRVYYWHPDATTPGHWAMAGVTVSAGTPGTESITETIMFRDGVGHSSLWDANGISERIREDLVGEPVAYASTTYSVPYRDYAITGANADTDYAVVFSYAAEVVEALYTFRPVPVPPEDYPDQGTCEAAGYYWWGEACHPEPEPVEPPPSPVDVTLRAVNYYTGAAIASASVYLDGTAVGMTDGDGYITLTGLIPGASHSVKWTHASVIDSDLDSLENDSFTVPT